MGTTLKMALETERVTLIHPSPLDSSQLELTRYHRYGYSILLSARLNIGRLCTGVSYRNQGQIVLLAGPYVEFVMVIENSSHNASSIA